MQPHMKQRILPVILSGGAGTRLWPASTAAEPKQFHALVGPRTLIAETLARVSGETETLIFTAPVIIANAAHADLAARESAAHAPAAIVLEPVARNTAAAAAVAAGLAREIDPEALVLLLPADHVIADSAAYIAAVERAAPIARTRIVTFGVTPSRPETGYGYIKSGAALAEGVFAIEAFKEKPVRALAERYLAEGGYAWNAGMFLCDPTVLLNEFASQPAIRDNALAALANARRDGRAVHLDEAAFAQSPSLPLDIAVMEETRLGAVAPCDIGWADVGAWDEIWRLSDKDEAGNANHGRIVVHDARGNLLRSDGPAICVAGISDLVVIATKDAVLIVPRDRAQDVKTLKELAEKLG